MVHGGTEKGTGTSGLGNNDDRSSSSFSSPSGGNTTTLPTAASTQRPHAQTANSNPNPPNSNRASPSFAMTLTFPGTSSHSSSSKSSPFQESSTATNLPFALESAQAWRPEPASSSSVQGFSGSLARTPLDSGLTVGEDEFKGWGDITSTRGQSSPFDLGVQVEESLKSHLRGKGPLGSASTPPGEALDDGGTVLEFLTSGAYTDEIYGDEVFNYQPRPQPQVFPDQQLRSSSQSLPTSTVLNNTVQRLRGNFDDRLVQDGLDIVEYLSRNTYTEDV
ncbi:hypothetical protein HK102_001694, partial [Quaeritorhiza haematococci]